MEKIIFLEFDGVLNTLGTNYAFDRALFEKFGKILEATGAKIVVTSSWRGNNVKETVSIVTNPQNRAVMDNPFPYTGDIIDVLPFGNATCKEKISLWLDAHPGVKDYIILDDIDRCGDRHRPHLVRTSNKTGLTDEAVARAVDILNGTPAVEDEEPAQAAPEPPKKFDIMLTAHYIQGRRFPVRILAENAEGDDFLSAVRNWYHGIPGNEHPGALAIRKGNAYINGIKLIGKQK